MASPNPADHPLPMSPEVDPDTSPSTIPFGLPVPDASTAPTSSAEDVELLISELRASLSSSQTLLSTQATRLSTLSDVETELARFKDQYAFLTAAKDAVEAQLKEEVKKREVAEENVEMLRGQVEQARRGVMQLQKQDKERKRMSLIPGMSGQGAGSLGLGLGEEEVLSAEATQRESKLVKRQSMISRGHRRASSQSEPNDIHGSITASAITTSPNPQAGTLRPVVGGLRELRLGHTSPSNNLPSPSATTNNPHQSGYFDDPIALNKRTLTDSPPSKQAKEVDSKISDEEMARLRAELQATQVQLVESEEARVASETCLKALREFIAAFGGTTDGEGSELGDGGGMSASTAELLKGIRLPPLPTDRDHDDDQDALGSAAGAMSEKAKPSGWAFKLWANKAPGIASPALSTAVEPPATPQAALSQSSRSRAGSTTTATNPKASPLPTPMNEENSLTPSASTNTITPLSSFVSNWTRNVSPGKPPATPANSQGPAQASGAAAAATGSQQSGSTRKLSMPSFFSRASMSGKRGSTTMDKDLPTPPENEREYDLSHTPANGESEAEDEEEEGDGQLEPSPQIGDGLPGRVDLDKRKSQGTTVTDLKEELGTPEVTLKEVELSEGDQEGNAVREGEKVESLAV